jgi:hypothetical protein
VAHKTDTTTSRAILSLRTENSAGAAGVRAMIAA